MVDGDLRMKKNVKGIASRATNETEIGTIIEITVPINNVVKILRKGINFNFSITLIIIYYLFCSLSNVRY